MNAVVARRPLHTYSIVARDTKTGDLGVAVQSHSFCVGPGVIYAEAGVGVVAVQADSDAWYGDRALAQLRNGDSAQVVLAALLQEGPRPKSHQIAIVDCNGTVGNHTGAACIAEAGHAQGGGFSAQANMVLSGVVWPAMQGAFQTALGKLAERLLVALDAAEASGGDIRGAQSAALVIVRGSATGNRRVDRPIDLRVDDHPTPLRELRRLLQLQRATEQDQRGFKLMSAGDAAAAASTFDEAARLAPQQSESRFWRAWALLQARRDDDARNLLEDLLAVEPQWGIVLLRMAEAESVALDDRMRNLAEQARYAAHSS